MQVPNLCEGAPSPTFLVSPLRHGETRSLLEETLEVEPVGKAVDPVIGGEICLCMPKPWPPFSYMWSSAGSFALSSTLARR
jgi:hypothetical protein